MKKMTLQDLKFLFPLSSRAKPGRDGKWSVGATKKNHRHAVNPVWLPGTPGISPAAYRRQHLGKKLYRSRFVGKVKNA
jgi:hypothetical protein